MSPKKRAIVCRHQNGPRCCSSPAFPWRLNARACFSHKRLRPPQRHWSARQSKPWLLRQTDRSQDRLVDGGGGFRGYRFLLLREGKAHRATANISMPSEEHEFRNASVISSTYVHKARFPDPKQTNKLADRQTDRYSIAYIALTAYKRNTEGGRMDK